MLLHLMHDTPLWVTALFLTVGAAVYSIGLTLIARWAYGVDRLTLNNEVAGFKFAVVGVFYAVMLAFVVIAVWEDFRKTEEAVRDEAKAARSCRRCFDEAKSLTTAVSLDAPLDRKLQFYLGKSRKLLPDLEATYDQLVARIQANGADILVPP